MLGDSPRQAAMLRTHQPIREALPFLLLLVVTLAAVGGINLALHIWSPTPQQSLGQHLVWLIYVATWLLLLLCTGAALAQRETAMRRERIMLAVLLAVIFGIDLINVNVRLLHNQVAGLMLFLQAALLLVAMVALFTFLYWCLDSPRPTMQQRAFWWVPPPGDQSIEWPWQPAFLDFLYLSCVVSFSFYPNVEPIRSSSKLLVIGHFLVALDVDLILLARAVNLIPT
jgi:lysylphosphatidylglycerol synthetase-like protein (DUF2156 family)